MHLHSRLAAALGCAATLAMVGCASNGGSVTPLANTTIAAPNSVAAIPNGWHEHDGIMWATPHYMWTREKSQAMGRKHPNTSTALGYYGGAVETTPSVVLILWDFKKDPDGVGSLLSTYLGNMGGSGHNNIYTQYYQDIKGGSGLTYIGNPSSQLLAVVNYKKKAPTAPSASQMAEVAVKVADKLKLGTGIGTSYVVAAPYHHDPAGFLTQGWCAYHSTAVTRFGLISWTNLPYMPDGGVSCGARSAPSAPSDESATDEGVTVVEGHEQGESVTDPNPGLGWYDGANGQEIGDLCAWQNIQNDTFGSYSYTMQPMWSNASSACVHTY